ncbi:hypothetical protein [Streptomyces sp. NBC_01578]|uniref:hypothetical protein n=1 Tax=unclassified Streptomyces TaxID=2593676 RepID=UPI003866F828
MWGERDNNLVPIGQLIADLRGKGVLGKGAERAEQRAAQLSAIDEGRCCPWPLNWQRHHRVLADLVGGHGPALPHRVRRRHEPNTGRADQVHFLSLRPVAGS